jgi:uncharacterized protein YcfJ
MFKYIESTSTKGILLVLSTLFLFSNNTFARTHIINANIDSVEPIYMNYKIEKLMTPCQSNEPGCWNVNYQKRIQKSLQGYRVKLSYEGKRFTARMRRKPNGEQLKIRVRGDLLSKPSRVAVNALAVY